MIDTQFGANYQDQLGRMKKSVSTTATSNLQFGLTDQNKSVRDVEMAAVFV